MSNTAIQLPGKKTQIYSDIHEARNVIAHGVVLSVDPSIGSTSSMPGFAIYSAGELVTSGALVVDPHAPRWKRLKEVYRQLRNLSKQYGVDACVYELVPVSAHGGRSQVSHASLLMAVGVTIAAVDARAFVGIPPVSWKRYAREDYKKTDEADAVEIGRIVIEMAQLLISQEAAVVPTKKKK